VGSGKIVYWANTSWRSEVKTTAHFKSALSNKGWRVLPLSFRAVSAHGILTPRALTIQTSSLNHYVLVMLTKHFYLVVNYRKQVLLACLSECYIPMKETFQTHVLNVNPENSSKFPKFTIFVLVPYPELNIDFVCFLLNRCFVDVGSCSTRCAHSWDIDIKVISTSGHVILCLLYKLNILTMSLTLSQRFPTTFRKFSKTVPKARRIFPNIFLPFSEDCQRFPRRDQ